ncbi:hypothetical protein WR25_06889 [Diploscapter pachys]|uniref:Palmitoyltransferase n=1 Tax=Diploscapter pachys TaxID=2018661 RepID=A0A2A2L410_9BILA|nr:hypothetical protein WR25_06889 [Diploscapter pachys]
MYVKWWLVVAGWTTALTSWYQIILVLALGRNEFEFAMHKVVIWTGLWIVISCSFFSATFATPRPIPDRYRVSHRSTKDSDIKNLVYCTKCSAYKPHRTRHCKVCQRCIMRMDHHCPLIQIAMQIWNGKTSLTTEQHFINSAYMNAVVIAGSVGKLLWYQLKICVHNRTTIEDYKIDSIEWNHQLNEKYTVYDLGSRMANFKAIFGENSLLWLLPILNTPGDGVNYPKIRKLGREIEQFI